MTSLNVMMSRYISGCNNLMVMSIGCDMYNNPMVMSLDVNGVQGDM